MIEVRFVPISGWPGPKSEFQRRSPFSADLSSTLPLLDRELRMLNAENVVIQIGLRDGQIRQDGWPKAKAAAPDYPGVIIDFDSKHGHLRYATDEFDRYQDNLRAIALSLEALRRVDRYGVSRRGEQYRGWKALEAGYNPEDLLERGRKLIAKHGSVRAAERATHPDIGGDEEDFKAVQAAKDESGG